MDLFSISQLSRYSGIKPHTIRIWEQRYGALKPTRSEGNTRYYDNEQLRRLLNIVSLTNSTKYATSKLCQMTDMELFDMINKEVDRSIQPENQHEYYISQLIAAAMLYDELHFDKMLMKSLVRYGVKEAYTKVMHPLLVRTGLMWLSDVLPPASEHFMSNLLKQKMFAAIDELPPAKPTADKWLLFLKEDEFHEIGLLFANYMIRLSGKQVIYLGSNVPFASLAQAIRTSQPDYLLFFVVRHDASDIVENFEQRLTSLFTGKKIFVAGDSQLLSQLKMGEKIEQLQTVEELERALTFTFPPHS